MTDTAREQQHSRRRRRHRQNQGRDREAEQHTGHGAHRVEQIVFEEDEVIVGRPPGVIELEPVVIVGDPMAEDKIFEYMAQNAAYVDELTPAIGRKLAGWGYRPAWQDVINDQSTGFFAGLLLPDEQSDAYVPGQLPVIVFRGSLGAYDWVENMDPVAVGARQFRTNQALVRLLIAQAGGCVDLTGHSLGGSLAQQAAAANSSSIRRVVTFQAPGISADAVQQFQAAEHQPEVTHHVSRGDVVDLVGDQHLPGEILLHGEWANPYTAHTRPLLNGDDRGTPVQDADYAVRRAVSEGARRLIGAPITRPVVALDLLLRDDDSDLSAWVQLTPEATLAGYPTTQRAAAIDRLRRGITGDRDEQAVLKLLRASAQAGDLVPVVDAADAYLMTDALDGAEFRQLRQLLRTNYFPHINQERAFALLCNCIDGATAEWEEELIADLLTALPRAEGSALVTRLGQHYHDEATLNAGRLVLKEQLDGADWGRVVAAFGLPE
jgi:pimeloyl-ACP methyl ester carboxylesterase